MRIYIPFFSCCFLLASTLALAEPRLGRMPDGRAYRIADGGVELVDHLAELELTVEELKTRVHGLEYEVEEKSNIIAALKNDGAKESEIQELDLMKRPVIEGDPQLEQRLRQLELERDNMHVELKLKQAQLDKALANKTNTDIQLSDQELKKQLEDLQIAFFKEQETVTTLNDSLLSVRRDFELLKNERDRLLNKQANVGQVANSAIECDNSNIKELEARYAHLQAQNDELAIELLRLKDQRLANAIQAETSPEARQVKVIKPLPLESRARLAPLIPVTKLQDVKADLKAKFSRVRGMSIERERRYRLHRMSLERGQATIKLQPLKTKNGVLLNSISAKISRVSDYDQVSKIESDIAELRTVIERDMALLSRIS